MMELSSDFIKENEQFLKSCILYEVLQKKSIIKAYKNFCDTVGEDAMNFPDFEFWFHRFSHGCRDFNYDLSADQEPKTIVDERVVSMYYILYEVLQKKPIFDSYRNFCRTVGTDAMEYRDFEFWYYRFYHGNRDFDFDRSADPEPKTIMDMPVKLMLKIAENLDSVERIFLRSMNHAIKTVADSFPPVFEKIEISVSNTSLQWKLNNQSFLCFKKGFGCEMYKPISSRATKSEKCYMEKGIEHLALVLKMCNFQVNHFSLTLFHEVLDRDDFLSVPIKAKSAFILGQTMNKVVQFLSTIIPGHLESICLDGLYLIKREDYSMLFETDQFKQAKSVNFPRSMEFSVEDLVNFSHLERFKCRMTGENTFEDVPRIRDIISTFKELESCELEYNNDRDDSPIVAFAVALGEEIPIEPSAPFERLTITHRYQITESNECLEFKIKDEGYYRCRASIAKLR